jgi:hypothetical protein
MGDLTEADEREREKAGAHRAVQTMLRSSSLWI